MPIAGAVSREAAPSIVYRVMHNGKLEEKTLEHASTQKVREVFAQAVEGLKGLRGDHENITKIKNISLKTHTFEVEESVRGPDGSLTVKTRMIPVLGSSTGDDQLLACYQKAVEGLKEAFKDKAKVNVPTEQESLKAKIQKDYEVWETATASGTSPPIRNVNGTGTLFLSSTNLRTLGLSNPSNTEASLQPRVVLYTQAVKTVRNQPPQGAPVETLTLTALREDWSRKSPADRKAFLTSLFTKFNGTLREQLEQERPWDPRRGGGFDKRVKVTSDQKNQCGEEARTRVLEVLMLLKGTDAERLECYDFLYLYANLPAIGISLEYQSISNRTALEDEMFNWSEGEEVVLEEVAQPDSSEGSVGGRVGINGARSGGDPVEIELGGYETGELLCKARLLEGYVIESEGLNPKT